MQTKKKHRKTLIHLKQQADQENILIKMYIFLGGFDQVIVLENKSKQSDANID